MEANVQQVYSQLGEIKNSFPKIENYYSKINQLNISPLQEGVLNRDYDYLKKVSTILHVIISIISKPHLSNKREEIVARIEEVKRLDNEDFGRVLKDGSLWKKYGAKLVPERVYYYQNVDLLAIYENRFIVLVVECLEKELDSFSNFYVKTLPQIVGGTVDFSDKEKGEKILKYVLQLKRRINYIKNTHFYVEVSKAKRISRNIQKTNILLKDPLYSRVYRFYNTYLLTAEKFLDYDFFASYLQFYLFKELSSRKFKLKSGVFSNNEYSIALNGYGQNRGLIFTITHLQSGKTANHLLIFSLSNWFADLEKPVGIFDTIEAICPFGISIYEKRLKMFDQIIPEGELFANYLDSKLQSLIVPTDIYAKYCPVCHGKNPLESDGVYHCTNCSSRYLYVKEGENYSLWFVRQRRK